MHRLKSKLAAFLFVAPALSLITLYFIYPTFWTIRLSFYTGLGYRATKFVGLKNYAQLFTTDPFFLKLKFPPSGSLINNIIWLLFFPTLTIGLGLVIAVLADKVRYESIVKSVIFMPMAISFTAAGVIWRLMYSPDPNIGFLNAVLTSAFRGFQPISWLGSVRFVSVAIIMAAVWMSTGFAMVVLSAAIKGLPHELIEAAVVDGANGWQIFAKIQFPLLSPILSFLLITDIIAVIKVFDLILIMGGPSGGPAGSARVIAFTQYIEVFQNARIGYGSAVAVIMMLLIIPVMILNLRRFREEEALR